MRTISLGTLAILTAVAGVARPAGAATILYATLTNMDGSTVAGGASGGPSGTDNSIVLDDFAVSFTRSYANGVLGPVDFSPVCIDAPVGPQSPFLVADLATQQRFRSLTVNIYKTTGGAQAALLYAKWKVSDPTVTSYGTDGSTESYQSDSYGALQYNFYSYKADGSLQGSYQEMWNRTQETAGLSSVVASPEMIDGIVPDFQFVTLAAVPEPTSLAATAISALILSRRARRR